MVRTNMTGGRKRVNKTNKRVNKTNKRVNKTNKRVNKTNKGDNKIEKYKTKYKSQPFSSIKMPIVHPLRYRAMRLVDNFSRISDFIKDSLLKQLVREEYERRLKLMMKKAYHRKLFQKITRKKWKNTINLSKFSSKIIEEIFFFILEKRRS